MLERLEPLDFLYSRHFMGRRGLGTSASKVICGCSGGSELPSAFGLYLGNVQAREAVIVMKE